MDIQDMRAQYTVPIDSALVKTFDAITEHPKYGQVHCMIYRTCRNDNGIAREATIRSLKSHEPDVGFWPGDVIRYYDLHGELLEEVS